MRDIYAGLILGLVIGTIAYRSVYAALFDSRFNHIPLPPFSAKTRFSYCRLGGRGPADETKAHEEEVDRLVVWNWWRSGSSDQSREKERIWLRNVRSMQITGPESDFSSQTTFPRNERDMLTMQCVGDRVRAASTGQIASPCSPRACYV